MCLLTMMNHSNNDNNISMYNNPEEEDTAATHDDMTSSRFLPESFEPNENEVVLGRGKQIASHPGNVRFKEIVLSHIQEYSAAQTKALKSSILSHIVNKIRNNSPFKAGFVKQDNETGRWSIAEDSAARIASAQIFRDALHDNYKSSKQFKQQRRNDRKSMAKKRKAMREATESSLGLSQQGYTPLSFPPASADLQLLQQQQQQQQQQPQELTDGRSGAQDQLMGHLSSVLASFSRTRGTTSGSSLASMFAASAALPNISVPSVSADPPQVVKEANDNVVAILFDHFGDKNDSNPFEPTPISEEAIIVPDSQGQGFRLREPFSEV